MPKSEHVKTCNEAVQTIIHCYPHILKENQFTKVYSNHGCQTAITISPKLENINMYPSLEFIPYERIAENSIRELDLPRKAFLHWRLPTTSDESSHHLFSPSFNRTSTEDGDVFHQKSVLKKTSTASILGGHKFVSAHHRLQRIMKTQGVQTALNVSPHVLEPDEVAIVYIERGVQTSVTCTPDASISSVVPRLKANLTHNPDSIGITEYLEFCTTSSTEKLANIKSKKIAEKVEIFQSTESMDIHEKFTINALKEVDESQTFDTFLDTETTEMHDATNPKSSNESIHTDFEFVQSTVDDKSEPNIGENLVSNVKSDIPKPSTNDNELRSVVSDGNAPEIVSNQKSACSRKCLCGNRKLNSIAHKLRVQASTLKLSQKVFPAGVQFEDRIIEVLNTTVAIFQTEMANILEVYVDDDCKTESCLTCNQETDETDNQSDQIKQEDLESIVTPEGGTMDRHEVMDQDVESTESYCKLLENKGGNETVAKVESMQDEEADVVPNIPILLQLPEEAEQEQPSLSHLAEPIGDPFENKRLINISSECHPTGAGADPSLLNVNTPTTSRQQNGAEQPAPSWVTENGSNTENNVKFEVLLKNTIKDLESSSAIVIRATISSPNTKKTSKDDIIKTASLPDLREQVIRLSIFYKCKSTESEKLVEEILPPTKVQIQMPSGGSHLEKFESELLIRCTSCEYNNSFSAIGKKQSLHSKSSSEISCSHIKVENVRFSSMTCPVHPDKASCPPGPVTRTSKPETQKQTCVQPSSKGNIEITVSCHLSLDSYKNDENDEKFSLMYEHEEEFDEPYISMLYDEGLSAGVQTDIALGEKLESTSLNSLNPEVEENVVEVCDSKTEIPWQTISLPAPGSYQIKKQEKIPYVPYIVDEEPTAVVAIEEVMETQPEEVAQETEEGGEGEEENEEGEGEDDNEEGNETAAKDVCIEPTVSVISKKSEKLIFEVDHQINEPYMEGLFKAFPDAVHKDSCTSHTEMPWNDIVLPGHCTIRKVFKAGETQEDQSAKDNVKVCCCRGRTDNALPAGPDDIINMHAGFDEPPSTLMPVNKQTISFDESDFSDLHETPKRVGKDYMFSISTSKGASSSVIVNIKPSTDCQFPSQKIAVCDDKYTTGKALTTSQSEMEVYGEAAIGTRGSISLPQIKANKTVRATISVKRLGLPDQIIIQKKLLTPGENIMSIRIPDEPIKINVKFSAPPLPPKDGPVNDLTCVSCVPEVLEEVGGSSITEVEPPEGEPEEMTHDVEKVEENEPMIKEPIKDEPEMNPFKRDPIGSVLKAYETEMKPLRQALAQLQEKILSLNIPEIQAFMCPTAMICPPVHRISVSKRLPEPCKPPTCPVRSKHQVPARLSFSPQADSCSNRSRNSHYPFMSPAPSYSNSSPYHFGYDSRGSGPLHDEPSFMESTYSSKSRQHKLDRHPFRMQEYPYPKKDLAMQARNYGMYPDYRGRVYPDERIAYQNSYDEYSFEDDLPERNLGRKFKIRHVISIHSKDKMADCGAGGSSRRSKPKTSDKSTNKCRDSSTRRRQSSRKSSQTGNDLDQNCIACKLRPGQAVKTSPDEFLPQVKRHKTESVGTCTSSRIKITIPYE